MVNCWNVNLHHLMLWIYTSCVSSNNKFGSKFHCVDINCTVCVCNPQGHGMHGHGETVHIPFPFDEEDLKAGELLHVDKAIESLVTDIVQPVCCASTGRL